jgi:hypothetical protein
VKTAARWARTEFDVLDEPPVGSSEELVAAMEAVQRVHVSEPFLEHVIEVVNRNRRHPNVELGASASLARSKYAVAVHVAGGLAFAWRASAPLV